jgi:hypothetical protein
VTVLVAEGVEYFSYGDEQAFFGWLKRIKCVAEVKGVGRELLITVRDGSVGDKDLTELVGLFHRYRVDKKQLAQFLTEKNASWFRDPDKFWHRDVFG